VITYLEKLYQADFSCMWGFAGQAWKVKPEYQWAFFKEGTLIRFTFFGWTCNLWKPWKAIEAVGGRSWLKWQLKKLEEML